MKKKQPLPILSQQTVLDAASDGRGVFRYENQVVFVEGAIPGDVIDARVVKKERKSQVAVVERLLTPSQDRTSPVCTHFGLCGGCKWQNMRYETQLFYKQKQVQDAIERIGGLKPETIFPILAAPEPFFYRNKLEYTFSNSRWFSLDELREREADAPRGDALGFHVPKYFDKIIELEQCFLQRTETNAVRNGIAALARAQGWDFYDIKAQTGLMRTLVFRTTETECMLMLLLGRDEPAVIEEIAEYLQKNFPFVTTFLWAYNPKRNDSYNDLTFQTVFGKPYLTERLGEYTFEVGPTSFFQTNSRQAERMYDVVKNWVGEKMETIYDLYCGAGTIGIFVSELAARIVGVEYVAAAVADAEKNLLRNGLNHLHFHAGDLHKNLLDDLAVRYGKPDVVITDPPRAGMEGETPAALLRLAPQKIIYVSCNPATQARDLQTLAEDYTLSAIQPVDMFPQTAHVENVALLRRK